MIRNLTQESGIGKALCIAGIIAIVVGVIEFFSGVGAMADASGYFEEVSKLSANIQLIGAAGSAIGGFSCSGSVKWSDASTRFPQPLSSIGMSRMTCPIFRNSRGGVHERI